MKNIFKKRGKKKMNLKKVLCAALSTVTAVYFALRHAAVRVKCRWIKRSLQARKPMMSKLSFKIPVYDRGMQGQADVDNNYWTDYVQKEFR